MPDVGPFPVVFLYGCVVLGLRDPISAGAIRSQSRFVRKSVALCLRRASTSTCVCDTTSCQSSGCPATTGQRPRTERLSLQSMQQLSHVDGRNPAPHGSFQGFVAGAGFRPTTVPRGSCSLQWKTPSIRRSEVVGGLKTRWFEGPVSVVSLWAENMLSPAFRASSSCMLRCLAAEERGGGCNSPARMVELGPTNSPPVVPFLTFGWEETPLLE